MPHVIWRDRIQALVLFSPKNMHKLTRVHHSGTRAVIRQHADGGWRINLDLYEGNQKPLTIVGYLSPTEEKAMELADSEILRHGHVCNAACKGWVWV